MNKKHFLWIGVLIISAFLLRFDGISSTSHYLGDQEILVRATANYLSDGFFKPDEWVHPPLRYYFIEAGMKLFGQNPYGWRMKNVIFGSLTVLMVYILGKELFRDTKTAFAAATFLAFEPVHIFYSRDILGEVPSIFFFLVAVWTVVAYLKGRLRSPIIAGLCIGIAVSHKWYYFGPYLALLFYYLTLRSKRYNWTPGAALHTFGVFILLPVSIYLLQYYPWISRGYSLIDFFNFQVDVYRELQSQTQDIFGSSIAQQPPWSHLEWFIRPIIYGRQDAGMGPYGNFFILMLNPLTSLFVLPAAAFAVYRFIKGRDCPLVLVFLLFLSTYGQFAMVRRPLFLYSSIVVLPFAYLFVAYGLTAVCNRFSQPGRVYRWSLIVFIIWGLYLYPLVIGRQVLVAAYKPLFLFGKVTLL